MAWEHKLLPWWRSQARLRTGLKCTFFLCFSLIGQLFLEKIHMILYFSSTYHEWNLKSTEGSLQRMDGPSGCVVAAAAAALSREAPMHRACLSSKMSSHKTMLLADAQWKIYRKIDSFWSTKISYFWAGVALAYSWSHELKAFCKYFFINFMCWLEFFE